MVVGGLYEIRQGRTLYAEEQCLTFVGAVGDVGGDFFVPLEIHGVVDHLLVVKVMTSTGMVGRRRAGSSSSPDNEERHS